MRNVAALGVAVVLAGCAATGGGSMGADTGNTGPAVAGAGSGYSAVTPNQMRIEWQADQRGNRPRVTGYVYNTYIMPARNIILRVEGLDANGQVIERSLAYVDRIVMPSNRSYWEVSVPRPAASYRVNVESIHWIASDR